LTRRARFSLVIAAAAFLLLPSVPAGADLTLFSRRNDDGEPTQFVSMIGYIQVRYTHINKDSATEDQVFDSLDLHRARLGFRGQLHKYLLFKLEIDYSRYIDETRIYETYVRIPVVQYCELTGGVFKAPIRATYLTSGAMRLFADTPLIIHETEKVFQEVDAGGMIGGNLFPITQISWFEKLPRGILRYYGAVQSGNENRFENNEDLMFTGRIEVNPFGFRGYYESDVVRDHWLCNVGLNYGTLKDTEFEQEPADFHRKRDLYGVDGFIGYKGVCLSAGWFVYEDIRQGRLAFTDAVWTTNPQPSLEQNGYYIQVGAFVPVPWDKLRFLNNVFELKFRYQYFTPQKNIGAPNPLATLPSDIPTGITDPRRPRQVVSFGLDAWLFEEHLRMFLEYHIQDEVGYYLDGDVYRDTQFRDNEILVQMQLKF